MANLLNLSGIGKQANALVRNVRSQLPSSIGGLDKNLPSDNTNLPTYLSSEETNALVYPMALRGQPNVHCIEFTAHEKGTKGVRQHHIFFPCPANIAINDSATYNTVNLGTLGGAISSALENKEGGLKGMVASLKDQMGAATDNFKTGEIANAVAQKLLLPENLKAGMNLQSRTLLNPNTNTTFTGNAIRSFTFAFKMVASSSEEAEVVRKIHSKFRTFTYANSRSDSQNLILEFPPTWTIRFLDAKGNEIKYLPKIFSCYLVSIESSFNSTTNMFHEDGAPLEVDISVSYQETRTLTRQDINDLESGSLGEDRGIDQETGAAKTSGGNIEYEFPTEKSAESNIDKDGS